MVSALSIALGSAEARSRFLRSSPEGPSRESSQASTVTGKGDEWTLLDTEEEDEEDEELPSLPVFSQSQSRPPATAPKASPVVRQLRQDRLYSWIRAGLTQLTLGLIVAERARSRSSRRAEEAAVKLEGPAIHRHGHRPVKQLGWRDRPAASADLLTARTPKARSTQPNCEKLLTSFLHRPYPIPNAVAGSCHPVRHTSASGLAGDTQSSRSRFRRRLS